MSKRDDHLLLADIQESIEKVVRYTAGMDFDAFLADEKTKDAVVRNLEIIGEAANSLSPNYIASRSQVPWRKVAAFRNRLIHEYFGVDYEMVWLIIQHNLPTLAAFLQKEIPSKEKD